MYKNFTTYTFSFSNSLYEILYFSLLLILQLLLLIVFASFYVLLLGLYLFFYCCFYSYCSSNYLYTYILLLRFLDLRGDSKKLPVTFLLLLFKSCCIRWKSDNYVWEAIYKRNHEPMYKTDAKNEAKRLRVTTSHIWKSINFMGRNVNILSPFLSFNEKKKEKWLKMYKRWQIVIDVLSDVKHLVWLPLYCGLLSASKTGFCPRYSQQK